MTLPITVSKHSDPVQEVVRPVPLAALERPVLLGVSAACVTSGIITSDAVINATLND